MSAIENSSTEIQPITLTNAAYEQRRSSTFRRLIVLALFVTTFGCGVVAGGLFASNRLAQHIREGSQNPEHHGVSVLEQMKTELELSEEQVVKVKPLIDEHFRIISQIRQQAIPQVVKEQKRLEEQVAVHLNESQKETWQERCRWVREHCYGGSNSVHQ